MKEQIFEMLTNMELEDIQGGVDEKVSFKIYEVINNICESVKNIILSDN